jgi:hypothetical protein
MFKPDSTPCHAPGGEVSGGHSESVKTRPRTHAVPTSCPRGVACPDACVTMGHAPPAHLDRAVSCAPGRPSARARFTFLNVQFGRAWPSRRFRLRSPGGPVNRCRVAWKATVCDRAAMRPLRGRRTPASPGTQYASLQVGQGSHVPAAPRHWASGSAAALGSALRPLRHAAVGRSLSLLLRLVRGL